MSETKTGPFYEDFKIDEKIQHDNGRTVTETDNIWFTLLTCNSNQVHYNKEYAKRYFSDPPFEGKLVLNSFLTLSIVLGISSADTSRNGIMLGLNNCKMLNPVFPGDTITAKTQVIGMRDSKSHENMGLITVQTTGFKNNGIPIIDFERTFMVRKRNRKWA